MAVLNVRAHQASEFEKDFALASDCIRRAEGYLSHELHRCLESKGRYLLLARWTSVDSHIVGFRSSTHYAEWKRRLHHYYVPFPTVEHYELVLENTV